MIKNLSINFQNRYNFKKSFVHKLIGNLKNELKFEIDTLIVNFIDSKKILEINKKYLNHNYSTDILTFNYSGSQSIFDSEIFISVNDAVKNAKLFNTTIKIEITRLVIHGILHIIGYDDMNKISKSTMIKKENELVNKLKNIKGFYK